ncbi:hypothetical protein [Streptomyces sp. MST-110588]|uniref:hypothetical protein n=1 Tax=Streptomyces sp. MST-110588 TaxID=2833628 RepID=UPI001F5DCE14|nr:hypothetical protein [Streptomyces sp. MST-110588]
MATIRDCRHRTPDTGHRTPAPVFGLSPEWLLHDGEPVAAATVLSHPEQLARLRASCPEAVPTAVLAGDPCFDRLLAALPYRDRFRRALGTAPGRRLIVLNSTWGPRSLFGDENDILPWLLARLPAELPVDEYRLCAVLHPNIWHGHGPGQVRAWLHAAQRAGLTLVPPLGPWRQVLAAADAVIGDHGSVTYYAAAIGTPVLLGAFPPQDLDPDSPVAALGRLAPRLRPQEPLLPQLDALLTTHDPDRYARLAEQTTSAPGASATLLRRAFYRLLSLPEPRTPACLPRLLDPPPGTAPLCPPPAPLGALTRLLGPGPDGTPEIAVTRCAGTPPPSSPYAYESACRDRRDPAPDLHPSAHTAVHEDTPDPGQLALADIVLHHARSEPEAWTHDALRRHPHCAMAACVTTPGSCLIRTADGHLLTLEAAPGPDGYRDPCDPTAYASALYAWYEAGRPLKDLAPGFVTVTGRTRHHIKLSVIASPV